MTAGMARMRLIAMGLLLTWTGHALSAPKPRCTVQNDGATSTSSVVIRVGSGTHRLRLTLGAMTLPGVSSRSTITAAVGKRTVLSHSSTSDGTTTIVTADFGLGFRGIHHVALSTTDGRHFTGTVDGRPITLDASVAQSAFVFQDGAAPPTVKVKRVIARLLAKVANAQGARCPANGGGVETRAIVSDCDLCKLGCQTTDGAGLACLASAAGSVASCASGAEALCAALWVVNGYTCTNGMITCENECRHSSACCKVACPDVVGQCCNGDGEICCGSGSFATCTTANRCCGTPGDPSSLPCGQRGYGLEFCVDQADRVCCEIPIAGVQDGGTLCGQGAGTQCCVPGGTCCNGSYCAPPNSECCSAPGSLQQNFYCAAGQRCADASQNLCCASDAGPACGTACCASGQVCGGGSCCAATDLCGSTCCPSHICLNGSTCCEPPNNVCGGNCCAPLQQCCNGQCCTGSCVGGLCCPPERSCGSTCCPDGWACTDPANSTCTPCPGGQQGCAPVAGNPTCCPTGTECCANGACCVSPTTCCKPSGLAVGCYTPDQCVQ